MCSFASSHSARRGKARVQHVEEGFPYKDRGTASCEKHMHTKVQAQVNPSCLRAPIGRGWRLSSTCRAFRVRAAEMRGGRARNTSHARTNADTRAQTHTHTQPHTHARAHTHIHTHTCSHPLIDTHAHTHKHTHTRTRTHTHTHTWYR